MKFPQRIRHKWIVPLLAAALTTAIAQEKPQPQSAFDLKPLGAAPVLFTDQSDS